MVTQRCFTFTEDFSKFIISLYNDLNEMQEGEMAVTKKLIEKLGIEVSMLGFGCMRFPTSEGKIDEERAQKMLDRAYNEGINYFDTAYPYHNGESEPFVGKALSKYPRDTYYLATKLPCWEIKSLDDAKRIFELQCSRIDGGYIDFYLLHALHKERWETMRDMGVVEYLEKMKACGRIKYLGFSFHDEYQVFEEIINYRDWDFCQIQYNYMDTEEQAGDKGYRLTEEKNVPLIIMEPVKGGLLANLPEEVVSSFKEVAPDKSTASWALRWVASHPNVKVVLSGMSDEEQVVDNLSTFTDFQKLSDQEENVVKDVAATLNSRVNNGCTACAYCMPCPAGVNIPGNFKIWNRFGIYGNREDAIRRWKEDLKDEERAGNCIKCGKCETVCPQKLSIREDLKKVGEVFCI